MVVSPYSENLRQRLTKVEGTGSQPRAPNSCDALFSSPTHNDFSTTSIVSAQGNNPEFSTDLLDLVLRNTHILTVDIEWINSSD